MVARGATWWVLGALTSVMLGCGSEDSDPAAEARAVVADYRYAVARGDEEAVCDLLTEEGQAQLVDVIDQTNRPRADDCVEALGSVFTGIFRPASGPVHAFEKIREGEGRVRVLISDGSGVVIAGPGPEGLRVGVEEVDGEWLISNGTGVLFEFGVDPIRPSL